MIDETSLRELKEVLHKSIETNFTAGANLLILKDGKELFYHEDGMADREAANPIRRDSIFRLYSMTKPVTATAVMILVERGIIDLYDPVSLYLEGFKNQKVEVDGHLVPVDNEIVIKDLLNMTSGLVYDGEDRAGQETLAVFAEMDRRLFGDYPMGTVEAMNQLGGCTLAYEPGSSWQYGTSADVLGAVVEVASGKRFGDFLKEEIFEPLGMKDTAFWVPEEKRERLVKSYAEDGAGDLVPYAGNHLGIINTMDREPAFESGGAGLASTIDDYAKFASMLMNGGTLDGVQVLRPRTVRYLTTGTLSDDQQKGFNLWGLRGHSYSNLMRVMTDCTQAAIIGSPGEYGWDGWLGAYFCNAPEERLTFLLLMQKKDAGTTTLTRKLRNIIFSSLSE